MTYPGIAKPSLFGALLCFFSIHRPLADPRHSIYYVCGRCAAILPGRLGR